MPCGTLSGPKTMILPSPSDLFFGLKGPLLGFVASLQRCKREGGG
jgi:hypothetical protein